MKAWRPHFRPARFEHIVIGRQARMALMWADCEEDQRPFFTLVITGRRRNHWGFFPRPGEFLYWKDYHASY